MIASKAKPSSRMAALVVALALASGAGAALAQTGDSTPPPASPAHARHMRGGDPLVGVLFHLKSQLALDSSQQMQWDNAVAQSKSARAQGATLRQGVKAAFDAEIAKDQPDLAAVSAVADSARTQGQQLQRTVRDAWLALYARLSPAQKVIVRDALRERAAKMAAWRTQRGTGG